MEYKLIYTILDDIDYVYMQNIIALFIFFSVISICIYMRIKIIKEIKQDSNNLEKTKLKILQEKISKKIIKNKNKIKRLNIIIIIFLCFSIFYGYTNRYNSCIYFNKNYINAYKDNQYNTLEGKVSNIQSYFSSHIWQLRRSHTPTSFSFYVKDEYFVVDPYYIYGYSVDFESSYNKILYNNQAVRISYVYDKIRQCNVIIKLEIV